MNLLKLFLTLTFFSSGICSVAQTRTKVNDISYTNTRHIVELRDSLWFFGKGMDEPSDVWKSADGINWEEVTSASELNWKGAGVVFKGKLYQVMGHKGSSATNTVYSSSDGKTWEQTSPEVPARMSLGVVVHNEKLFVLAGGGGSSGLGLDDVWYTEDGSTWMKATDKISDVFPHFWEPRVVSLNGKLILFGGHKTDFAFTDNERGVYISSNDGRDWERHEFPFPVNLDKVHTYFVYKNKLWIVAQINPNYLLSEEKVFNSKKKLFYTSDGIQWEELASVNLPIIENDETLCTALLFKGKPVSFSSPNSGSGTTMAVFEEPEIYLPNMVPVFKKASTTNVAPMVTEIADQTLEANGTQTIDLTRVFEDTEALVFESTSRDASVVTVAVSGTDNMLTLTGLSAGITSITVTATDTGDLTVSTIFEVTVNAPPTAILGILPVRQQIIIQVATQLLQRGRQWK